MLLNKIYQTNPYLVHAPGDLDFSIFWNPIKKSIVYKEQKKIENLNIFTWSSIKNSLSEKKLNVFTDCCEKYNYKYDKLIYKKDWTSNRIKIILTIDHLKKVNSDFVIGCDISDVLIVKPLDNIISDFINFDADLVFNAEIRFWPFYKMKHIKEKEEKISENYKIFKYLNAGLWIGKRKESLEFFKFCYNKFFNLNIHPRSEQVCIKHGYVEKKYNVKVDHECKLFQNLNLVNSDMIELF